MTKLQKIRQSILVINPGSFNLKWAVFDVLTSDCPLETGKESDPDIEDLLTELSTRYSFCKAVVRVVHGGQQFFEPLLVTLFRVSSKLKSRIIQV